jgi:hypothetical protein
MDEINTDETIVISRSVVLRDGKQRKCLAKRAWNRYQERKKKREVTRWWSNNWWVEKYGDLPQKWISQTATTPKHYPCVLCGNPRRWFKKKTVQEERADEIVSAQLAEIGEQNVDVCSVV